MAGTFTDQLHRIESRLANAGNRSATQITRPANVTAYTANSVIGGVFTLSNIGNAGEFIMFHNMRVFYRTGSIPSGLTSLNAYLYRSSPPSAFTNGATFSVSDADEPLLFNADPIVLPVSLQAGGSRLRALANLLNLWDSLITTDLFGYLVTPNAFTPNAVSEVITILGRSVRG
jgi:hypothetical protein